MQSRDEDSVNNKIKKFNLLVENEILTQQFNFNSSFSSFQQTLFSINAKSLQTVGFRDKIGKLKVELKEVDDDLVKALAAKRKKEAEQTKTKNSISATKARVEELNRLIEEQNARKTEYTAIMSDQYKALSASQGKSNKNKRDVRETEEAMSWYNKFLGFRIECGHGVRFIFTNIDLKNPSVEYSFTVRQENDQYRLLECDPQLKDVIEAMNQLNKSNDLFRFVRTMREIFLESAAHETNGSVKKLTYSRGKAALLSPGFVRRSPRIKVKKIYKA